MALTPTISACFSNCCKKLTITDTTDIYSATNTGGWNSPNIEYDDVSAATLTITHPSGTIEVETVTSQITDAAITGTFAFNDITGSFEDGLYTIVYSITDSNDNTYQYTLSTYNYCNAQCCIDKMWAQVPDKMCDNCDYEDYLYNTIFAQSLLDGLISSINCCNETAMDNILDKIQKYCSFNNCTNC